MTIYIQIDDVIREATPEEEAEILAAEQAAQAANAAVS